MLLQLPQNVILVVGKSGSGKTELIKNGGKITFNIDVNDLSGKKEDVIGSILMLITLYTGYFINEEKYIQDLIRQQDDFTKEEIIHLSKDITKLRKPDYMNIFIDEIDKLSKDDLRKLFNFIIENQDNSIRYYLSLQSISASGLLDIVSL